MIEIHFFIIISSLPQMPFVDAPQHALSSMYFKYSYSLGSLKSSLPLRLSNHASNVKKNKRHKLFLIYYYSKRVMNIENMKKYKKMNFDSRSRFSLKNYFFCSVSSSFLLHRLSSLCVQVLRLHVLLLKIYSSSIREG